MQELTKPFQTDRLEFKNRIVMAPMTRNKSKEGVPGADVVNYYRKRAEGGVGLIGPLAYLSFCRFLGSFEPIFNCFCGGLYQHSYTTPTKTIENRPK